MRARELLCSVLASLPCAGLCAQTVWPQGYAKTNGGASNATPFSISRGETIDVARRRAIQNLAEQLLIAVESW